jgi:ABC-type lipoprotein export system ATPase subunit
LIPSSTDHVVPIKLQCSDLNYHVGPRSDIHIMKAVNASFFPGEAVALMGPSGAGKVGIEWRRC